MTRSVFILIFILFITERLNSQDNYEVILKARALIDNGQPGEASAFLSAAISKSQDSRLYVLNGDANLIAGNMQAAISDYQYANKLVASSGDYGLARAYAVRRDVKNSLFHLERNISSSFRKPEKEIMLDQAFSAVENTPEWRLFWKTERYSVPEQKLSEIEFSISKSKREEAVLLLKELTASYPNDKNTLYAKALLDYSMQKYAESVTQLSELLSEDKNNPAYLLLLATVQMSSGNMPGASATYTRLAELEYPDAIIYLNRAGCYRKTQEYDKALKDLEKFLSLYPGNKEAISLSGKIESERGDNLKAIELYSQNIKLHPNDPQSYIDRANSYFVSRTWDSAVRDYSMALDIKPGDPEVWLNKGIALLNSGKTEDACFDFRKALGLGNKKATSYISRNCIK